MPRKKHAEIYGGDRFREYEARLEERLAQAEQRLSRGKNKHMHYAEYRAFKQALDTFTMSFQNIICDGLLLQ